MKKVTTYTSVEEWLKEQLREAKRMVKEYHKGEIMWRDYPVFLVNTTEGASAYYRETEKSAIVDATMGWDSEYGSVEHHNAKHFIFLNEILVSNWNEGDILSTMIHEILHIIYPNEKEESIEEMTEDISQRYNIEPEHSLEE